MDPSAVSSSQDVRDGWDDWSYSEREEALDQLANETLDQYSYDDDVDVATGDTGDYGGTYDPDDGSITLDPGLIQDPDPSDAIHTTNHETVHAMNDQDGVDDSSYNDRDDFNFDEDDLASLNEHAAVGDTARELDRDGFPAPEDSGASGGGGDTTGGAKAGESGSSPDEPKSEDLEYDIDWAEGVWIESQDESGNRSYDIMFEAPEGW
jgi:hypothetical protein